MKVRALSKLHYLHLKSGNFMTLVCKRRDETITAIVLKEFSKQDGNTVTNWQSLLLSKPSEFSFSKFITIFGVEMH